MCIKLYRMLRTGWLVFFLSIYISVSAQMAQSSTDRESVFPGLLYDGKEWTQQTMDLASDELVILDFWASWCTSCVPGLMKLDSLQSLYPGRVRFLLVNAASTKDDRKLVEAYYEGWKKRYGKPLSLSTLVGDSILENQFPHRGVPHYVWLYKGEECALSDLSSINPEVISALLSTGLYTGVRWQEAIEFGREQRLAEWPGREQPLLSSLLTPALAGVRSERVVRFQAAPELSRLTIINESLFSLLQLAYSFREPANRIIADDSILYRSLSHLYCFEWEGVAATRKVLHRELSRALEQHWGFRGELIDSLVPCIRITGLPARSSHRPVSLRFKELLTAIDRASPVPVLALSGLPEEVLLTRVYSTEQLQDPISVFDREGISWRYDTARLKVLRLRSR